jgi:hypothetical protein
MGFFLVFQVEQCAIKEEMKENIKFGFKDDRITVLTIDNNLITSVNNIFEQRDDEFTYYGNKFDIIKKEPGLKSTTFYVIHDTKEDHLLTSLDNHIQSSSDLPNKHSQNTKNLTKNLVKILFIEKINFSFSSVQSTSEFSDANLNYYSIDKKTEILPPELA